MFPKESLDMVILAIISEQPDGVTGYAIVKEMESRFGKDRAPSPGTVYPRLKNLKENGDIIESDKKWTLTPQGEQKLTSGIPGIIAEGMKFIPHLFKTLAKQLPFAMKLDFLPGLARFSGCPTCKTDLHADMRFDRDFIMEEVRSIDTEGKSINKLAHMKEMLEQEIEKRKQKLQEDIDAITEIINEIEEKIVSCKKEKESWKSIPISDEDFDE